MILQLQILYFQAPAHSGDMGKSSPGRSKSDDDAKKKDVEKRSADKVMQSLFIVLACDSF